MTGLTFIKPQSISHIIIIKNSKNDNLGILEKIENKWKFIPHINSIYSVSELDEVDAYIKTL